MTFSLTDLWVHHSITSCSLTLTYIWHHAALTLAASSSRHPLQDLRKDWRLEPNLAYRQELSSLQSHCLSLSNPTWSLHMRLRALVANVEAPKKQCCESAPASNIGAVSRNRRGSASKRKQVVKFQKLLHSFKQHCAPSRMVMCDVAQRWAWYELVMDVNFGQPSISSRGSNFNAEETASTSSTSIQRRCYGYHMRQPIPPRSR